MTRLYDQHDLDPFIKRRNDTGDKRELISDSIASFSLKNPMMSWSVLHHASAKLAERS